MKARIVRRGWHFGIGLMVAFVAASASAQVLQKVRPGVIIGPDGEQIVQDEDTLEGSMLPVDREIKRMLARAQEAVREKHFGDAVDILNEIIVGPKGKGTEDYFYPVDDKPTSKEYRSLKVDAQRLIASLPPEGRAEYERNYGSDARRLLTAAVQAGDITGLETVARNYLHTVAGREAAILLSQGYLDQNQPLAAALVLKRLQDSPDATDKLDPMLSISLASAWLRAGQRDKAQETLVALKKRSPRGEIVLGGKATPLFDKDADALNWFSNVAGPQRTWSPAELTQWTMFRGNAARNATSPGGSPVLNERWRVPTNDDPAMEKTVEQLKKMRRDSNSTVLPGATPLAVRDVVLMRTMKKLLAVDFTNGKRIWQFPPDTDSLTQPLSIDVPNIAAQQQAVQIQMGFNGPVIINGNGNLIINGQLVAGGMTDRLWDNATYSTLSSDGDYVYFIEDSESTPITSAQTPGVRRVILPNGQIQGVPGNGLQQYNRLFALELATEGKKMWDVGGSTGGFEPKLAGACFLGPPLPMMGKLYVLAEMNGVIQLVVLNAKTGKQEWTQQLAQINQNFIFDPFRKMSGMSPSYADGVLVCPTSSGTVVAVDLATRTLLWGYKYTRVGNPGIYPNNVIAMNIGDYAVPGAQNAGRWADGCATIADGHVLLTPLESDQIHCLSLLDGKLEWKVDRRDSLYLACIHQGKAILVGAKQVQAIRLSDGKPAWSAAAAAPTKPVDTRAPPPATPAATGQGSLALPGGATPSGRGFYSGSSYYLPLSSASVVRVDLDAGALRETFKSHHGYVPGNLICYKENVISLGVDYLEAFHQLEPLKARIEAQLKQNPDDVEALTRRGEMLLADGKLSGALADLRRAYKQNPQPETKDLLVEALLTSLRTDFVAYRGVQGEVEGLLEMPSQRAEFLRIKAAGLLTAGEIPAALTAYLQLAEIDVKKDQLERVSASYSVRRDRWLQGQLIALLAAAKPADREGIQAAVQQRLDVVLKMEDPRAQTESLRRFLVYFGTHPLADAARDRLASLLTGRETRLEKENLLRSLEQSPDAALLRSSVARLAILLHDAGRPEDAAPYYRRLAGEFADQDCLGGKTGAQIVGDLPEKSAVRKLIGTVAVWPNGEVRVERSPIGARTVPGSSTPTRVQQNRQSLPIDFRGSPGPFFEGHTAFVDLGQQIIYLRDGQGQERWQLNLQEKGIQNPYGYMPGLHSIRTRGHVMVLTMGTNVIGIDALRNEAGRSSDRMLWKIDLAEQVPGMPVAYRGINQQQLQNPWGGPQRYLALDGATNQPLGSVGPITAYGLCVMRNHDLKCLDPITGETLWSRDDLPQSVDIFGDDELTFIAPRDAGEAVVLRTTDGQMLGTRAVPAQEQRWGYVGRYILVWKNAARNRGGGIQVVARDPWQNRDVWSVDLAANSKGTLVGDDEVALIEPSGRFLLMDIATGTKRVETTLEPENPLNSLHVQRDRDQFIVIASQIGGQNVSSGSQMFQAPNGEMFTPLVAGHVYAFDRATGKSQWSMPAEVLKHGYIIAQPSGLPVLTFIRQYNGDLRGGGGVQRSSILCLDKRTGRAVFQDDAINQQFNNMFEIAGDRDARNVMLTYPNINVTLTFTDNPRPPEPPYQASVIGNSGLGSQVSEEPPPSPTRGGTRGPRRGAAVDPVQPLPRVILPAN